MFEKNRASKREKETHAYESHKEKILFFASHEKKIHFSESQGSGEHHEGLPLKRNPA